MGPLDALADVCAEELLSNQMLALVDTTGIHAALLAAGGPVDYLQAPLYQQLVQVLAAHAAQQVPAAGGLRVQLPVHVHPTQALPHQLRAPVLVHRPPQPVIISQHPVAPVPVSIPPTVAYRPPQPLPLKRPAPEDSPAPEQPSSRTRTDEARSPTGMLSEPKGQANPPFSSKPSAKPLIPGGPCENQFCGVVEAPQWRRIEKKLVCNRCGMYYHRHARFPDWSYFSGLASKSAMRHVVIQYRRPEDSAGGEQQPNPLLQPHQQHHVQILHRPPQPREEQKTLQLQPEVQALPSRGPTPERVSERATTPVAAAAGGDAYCMEASTSGGNSSSGLADLLREAGNQLDAETVQRVLTTPVRQLDIDTIRKLQALLGERMRQQQQTSADTAGQHSHETPASPQRGTSPGSPRSDSTFAPPTHTMEHGGGAAAGSAGVPAGLFRGSQQQESVEGSGVEMKPSVSGLMQMEAHVDQQQQPSATSEPVESPVGSAGRRALQNAVVKSEEGNLWEARRKAAAHVASTSAGAAAGSVEQRSRQGTGFDSESEAANGSEHRYQQVPVTKRARMTPPPADAWPDQLRRVQIHVQPGHLLQQQQQMLVSMLQQDQANRAAAAQHQRQQHAQQQVMNAQQRVAQHFAVQQYAAMQRQADDGAHAALQQQQQRRPQVGTAMGAGHSLMETIAAAAALQQQQQHHSGTQRDFRDKAANPQQQQRMQAHQQASARRPSSGYDSAPAPQGNGMGGGLLMRDLQQRALLAQQLPHPHSSHHPQLGQHETQQHHHTQQHHAQQAGQKRLSGTGYISSAAAGHGGPQLRMVGPDSTGRGGGTLAAYATAAASYGAPYVSLPYKVGNGGAISAGRGGGQPVYFANDALTATAAAAGGGRGAGGGGSIHMEGILGMLLARGSVGAGGGSKLDAGSLASAYAGSGMKMAGQGTSAGAALLPVLDLGKPSTALAF